MSRFVLLRAAAMVATVLVVAMAVSLVLTVLPGDAARLMVGAEATPERYEAARTALDLDHPWPARFARWLSQAVRGDLGISFRYPAFSVAELLQRGLMVTFPLAALVTMLSFLVGVSSGVLCVARLGGFWDTFLSLGNQIFLVLPEFWLGILLVGLFSVRLKWLPAGGFPGWAAPRAWLHLLLPCLALALPRAAYFSRLTRALLADVLFTEFVRTARAKGLSEARVLGSHALRNALLPLVASLGLSFARLLAGALVVEQVFSLPGLGKFAVEAALGRDIPLLLGLSVLVTTVVVMVSTIADIIYGFLDPRIRYA
ncbi:MAG: ABC transporter permease [Candidatus Bipolaricaulota bacterium]|nr:ABC transporter permease [Candidatus Bipolaricaulota bacterium]MDW8127243.1 ABC transporter permease [Candidatus Bipolaricaulota bacterium]